MYNKFFVTDVIKERFTELKKVIKRIVYFTTLVFCVLLCSGCSREEDAFMKEDFEEVQETSEKQQEDTKTTKEEDSEETNKVVNANTTADAVENKEEQVCVYVCGAVNKPGVYSLQSGKRIADAIGLAGGMKEDASQDCLNQAEVLSDAQMIRVLTIEEAQNSNGNDAKDKSGEVTADKGLVNINTATCDQLMTLPGIGQNKADSIIAYREENGKFNTVEDIMNITGIKEGVFNKIKNYITVD